MSKVSDWIRMQFLMMRAKLVKAEQSGWFQSMVSFDITFIFLFFALKLFGYPWNWITLLGSFGLWILIKELFKHLRGVASELRQR